MNAGDFGILVLLGLSLAVLIIGTLVFGTVGLVLGVRQMIKRWW
jgi:hypothetical protein